MTTNQIVQFKSEAEFKSVIAKQYMKAIENFFGDQKLALEFASNMFASVQRNPKLMECTHESLINSFITMASLKLMPSGVSGEAFVLPYKNKGLMEAQFQLGYQGLVTLFYRAGAKSIVAEIVHEKDDFSYLNGEVHHAYNPFADNRGEAIGAYVIVELQTGGNIYKVMSKKEILDIAQKFSKSYGGDFSPWSKDSDPQKWMWRKTVLKQAAKLVPKNETIYKALAADNEDSVVPGDKEDSKLALDTHIDIAGFKDDLESSKTLEVLERNWADIPADAKVQLKSVYERMHAIFTTEAKGN